MASIAQFFARFDPHYQLKLQQIQHSAEAEQYRAWASMERERYKAGSKWQQTQFMSEQENQRMYYKTGEEWKQTQYKAGEEWRKTQYKAGEEWRLTQYKTEQENQRLQKTLDREDQREAIRGQNAIAVEEMRGRNDLNLANNEHGNRLLQMQADLEHRMTMAGFESGILATQKIMDEDNKRRENLLATIGARSQLRGEVTKMLAGAIIQEKLAQKQHARDMEKMTHESDLKKSEQYFLTVCAYLGQLLDASKEQEAKAEIDRLFEEWGANA